MEQTSIKRFRPHPLYILSNLWRYLFILLLPLVRGLYYVVINSFSLTGGFQLAVNISNWLQGAWACCRCWHFCRWVCCCGRPLWSS